MKIFAVGWNYRQHNAEMQNTALPQEPTIFMKPDTALLKDGKPFFLPDFSSQVEYETELVFRICRLGKNIAPRFASRYYDAVTVGIDFTARDIQNRLRAAGSPWELSKAFDGSAAIGNFIPIAQVESVRSIPFHLTINNELRQQGHSADMIFSIDDIIAYISRFFTLRIGDFVFTGTPQGVGPVKIDDLLQGFIGEEKLLEFHVK